MSLEKPKPDKPKGPPHCVATSIDTANAMPMFQAL